MNALFLTQDEFDYELNGMCTCDMCDNDDDRLYELGGLDDLDAFPVRAAHARPDLPGS